MNGFYLKALILLRFRLNKIKKKTITIMKFNQNLLQYEGELVVYDQIPLDLTTQQVRDWVFQTGEPSSTLILYYYKKKLDQIRDKKLESLFSNSNLKKENDYDE